MNSRLELKFSGDLVKKVAFPVLKSVGNEATVFYSATGIRMIALHPEEIVTVVLRINSISFSHFSCKRQGFARVDLGQVYHRNLKHARDEDLVTIHAEWQDQKIGFVFDDDSIFITVTDREVEFAAVDKKFVLSEEDYKIRGLEENDQVVFAISRRYCGLLWNASLGSDIVYVCYSDGAPPMLRFPISGIDGDIRVYLKDK